jgi:hypothetical protein
MTSALVSRRIHPAETRIISDSELAAMPPAPHRAADLVARRAAARKPVGTKQIRTITTPPWLIPIVVLGFALGEAVVVVTK